MRREPDLAHLESGWVTENKRLEQEEKELPEQIKKSLARIRALFFANPKFKSEEIEYVVDSCTPAQIENMHEGAMSILRDDKAEVLKNLGLDETDWDRAYHSALEIATRHEQNKKQKQQEIA